MVDEVLNSFHRTLDYLRRLVADVQEIDMALQPNHAANHPAWVIGHLVYSCQAIGGEIGLAPWLPTHWEELYGTGSNPTPIADNYPAKAELLAVLANAEEKLDQRLRELGDEGLNQPLPDKNYRSIFPTLGHAVVHVLTSHTAVHVGQVSVWRRAAGAKPLAESFI